MPLKKKKRSRSVYVPDQCPNMSNYRNSPKLVVSTRSNRLAKDMLLLLEKETHKNLHLSYQFSEMRKRVVETSAERSIK